MGVQLWRLTDQVQFGNAHLIEFLEAHGAEYVAKTALSVPAAAFRAALEDPEETGLTEEDVAFIKQELESGGYGEDDTIDLYDVW